MNKGRKPVPLPELEEMAEDGPDYEPGVFESIRDDLMGTQVDGSDLRVVGI